ncbi:MAG: cache domain-containing protein [Micropepsaceae bacterium]
MTLSHVAGPCNASTIRDVVQQKAEAVSIVKSKARKYAVALAQGRLFSAYLMASTQSEGDRLKSRISSSFRALENHYGMRNFTVIDRSGELFLHVGPTQAPAGKRNLKTDPVLVSGFSQELSSVTSLMEKDTVTYVSPVVHNGEKEFVLSIEQDLSAYEKVLTLGLAKSFYVVVIDSRGNIISDSHGAENAGKQALIAGMTFDRLRQEISGSANDGTGVVSKDGQLFNVSYETVDDWIVVAIEQSNAASACLRNGVNTCQ